MLPNVLLVVEYRGSGENLTAEFVREDSDAGALRSVDSINVTAGYPSTIIPSKVAHSVGEETS